MLLILWRKIEQPIDLYSKKFCENVICSGGRLTPVVMINKIFLS